jgi:hypothetical protein
MDPAAFLQRFGYPRAHPHKFRGINYDDYDPHTEFWDYDDMKKVHDMEWDLQPRAYAWIQDVATGYRRLDLTSSDLEDFESCEEGDEPREGEVRILVQPKPPLAGPRPQPKLLKEMSYARKQALYDEQEKAEFIARMKESTWPESDKKRLITQAKLEHEFPELFPPVLLPLPAPAPPRKPISIFDFSQAHEKELREEAEKEKEEKEKSPPKRRRSSIGELSNGNLILGIDFGVFILTSFPSSLPRCPSLFFFLGEF